MGVRKGIGELLVRENLIDIEQLEKARQEQKQTGGRLTSALVHLGFVNHYGMIFKHGYNHFAQTSPHTNSIVLREPLRQFFLKFIFGRLDKLNLISKAVRRQKLAQQLITRFIALQSDFNPFKHSISSEQKTVGDKHRNEADVS